jgi:hypothetical protein
MDKKYLNDLKNKNILVVKTFYEKQFNLKTIQNYFEQVDSDELIIKPVISANADNTFRISKRTLDVMSSKLELIFNEKEFMVQPFMNNIIDEGEYSLFFFGGKYSHTINKIPKENDFRVQEEHGGVIKRADNDLKKIALASDIINKLEKLPLYARVDLVRTKENNFALMELELIEPSLYFNYDDEAPVRFVKIFDEWIKK